MDRRDLTERILQAKRRKGITYAALAEEVGADRVWLTAAQIDAEKSELKRQAMADHHWDPLLRRAKALALKPETRVESERILSQVDDPRAVPAVWRAFATAGSEGQLIAVRLLGQIQSAPSSRGLATLSTFGRTASVRQAALEALARRDPREFADLLIGLLRNPVKYEVRPVGGPDWHVAAVLLVPGGLALALWLITLLRARPGP